MSRLRILLVDDEPDIRDVVELSLGLDPVFSVRSCDSGANALAAAVDWSPDMILCDVMMPDMDGPATLARLRDCPQTAGTPVVFMTARAQTRELEHFASLGGTGVIAKPFDPMNLANRCAAICARRGSRRCVAVLSNACGLMARRLPGTGPASAMKAALRETGTDQSPCPRSGWFCRHFRF
jgi:CheY-like chemotaxis protein